MVATGEAVDARRLAPEPTTSRTEGPACRTGSRADGAYIAGMGNVPSFVEIGRAVAAIDVTMRRLVACQRSECLFFWTAR